MRILGLTYLYPNPFDPHLAPFNRHLFRVLGDRNPVRVIAPIPWTAEVRGRWKGAARLPADRRAELDGLAVDHPRLYFPPKFLQRSWGLLVRDVRPAGCSAAGWRSSARTWCTPRGPTPTGGRPSGSPDAQASRSSFRCSGRTCCCWPDIPRDGA